MTESRKKHATGVQPGDPLWIVQYQAYVCGIFADEENANGRREEVLADPSVIMEYLGLESFFPSELSVAEYQLL
jgi:hypothetical protein